MSTGSTQPAPHHPTGPARQRVNLLGFEVDSIAAAQTLDHIAASIRSGTGGWVLTPNLEILRRIVREPDIRALCERATLRTPDGMPLIWASRLQGTPLPERVPGSDLIHSLTERAAREGFSIYLLGGDPGVGEQAAARLRELHPRLRVAGVESPPYGFEKNDEFARAMVDRVVKAAPDIVFVALSFPKQERLIERMRPLLPKAWFLGIGISFSFVTGDVPRAPRWAQAAGLEWFHRLLQEPRKLFKRYLILGVPFAIELLVRSTLRRARGPRS